VRTVTNKGIIATVLVVGAAGLADLAEREPVASPVVVEHVLRLDVPSCATDVGEYAYLRNPARIVDAIRKAEGVPSHGNMVLARQYGGHRLVPEEVGRAATGRLLHTYYRYWVRAGRPGTFLEWVAARYAPLGAANDPWNLNAHWLPNVIDALSGDHQ
jgi:hypothetical protein